MSAREPISKQLRAIPEDEWPVRRSSTAMHVYIIQEGDGGPVKIGIARNAFWRITDLQCGNFRRLHIRAVFEVADRSTALEIESAAHAELTRHHSLGGEWFDCLPEIARRVILGGQE